MMKNRGGFTLAEIMVAVMLGGILLLIALPLILTEQRIGRKLEENANTVMVGDAIFEYVKDELTYADRVFIGDNEENVPPEDEEWKAIYVSGKVKDLSQKQARLVMEACALEPCRLRLTVRLMDGEGIIYERTEELDLLNLPLHENGRIEGYTDGVRTTAPMEEGGEKPLVLWYQNENGEEE